MSVLTNAPKSESIKEIKRILAQVPALLGKADFHGPVTIHFAHGVPKLVEYKATQELGG